MKPIFKRFTAAALSGVLVCSLCVSAFAAGSLDHFKKLNTYTNQFSDIGGWYESYVVRGYELGLFDGTGEGTFSPASSVTVGEAVKIAACLNSIYETGAADFTQSDPWWQVYADYCLEHGIMQEAFSDYSNAVSRGQFAQLLAAALPKDALTEMNTVADESIPDVRLSDSYGAAVYQLYRAGVLTGSDRNGTFRPASNLSRSEMAAIVCRMVSVTARQSVVLGAQQNTVLSTEQIYAKCAPSVFLITTYDTDGEALSSGSGVFLSRSGEAVTNWHVLDGASSAKITTYDGKTCAIKGIYDYDVKNDLARIQIDGSGFTPMAVNYSGSLLTGASVYTIGNPLGLESTLSTGIVSSSRRTVNGTDYIQVTAPISNGSSGGALINAKGELIGITSASVSKGQNLNLAIPITALTSLKYGECSSVSDVVQNYIRKLSSNFRLSQNAISLNSGDSITVRCSLKDVPSGYYLSYEISTRGVVQCAWGNWEDDGVKLTLTGRNPGDAVVTVQLHNRLDAVIAERTISVRVR